MSGPRGGGVDLHVIYTSNVLMKLLIVESPGKIKTLKKILGAGWRIEASIGHTTELASDGEKRLGFEIREGKVETRYIPRGPRGRAVLKKLRAAVKIADEVFLAMDPDREGEAIAWHLVQQLRLKKFARVAYTQITESAVKAAIRAPRGLDLPLIQSQRARQCLDKLVGYEVSPLLWRTTGGKSAGRVQSATLHIVCLRERERLNFVRKDYWNLHAHYANGMIARYEPATGKEDISHVASAALAKDIEKIAKLETHRVESLKDREEKRQPLPPLITSSLQQVAGVRFKFSPQQTMKVAQSLYEDGLITYMRTDATTLSPEFIAETRAWLTANAPEALPLTAPIGAKSSASAQNAHEAIRPTDVGLTPQRATALSKDQAAVYRLIWERAVASQCRPARLARSQVEIFAGPTRWVARGLRILDPGYLIFWKNIEDERELPPLVLKQALEVKKIVVEKKTTEPPPRYSEAKLVQIMEKLGIGRPSTYASTVMTLKERTYVALEAGALKPTALGMATDEFLMKALPDLVDAAFTAQMEKSLDLIAENRVAWEKFLNQWLDDYFKAAMKNAQVAASRH